MPRKQRFKPSRKPKPNPPTPTEELISLGSTSAQYDEMVHSPEVAPHADTTPPDRA